MSSRAAWRVGTRPAPRRSAAPSRGAGGGRAAASLRLHAHLHRPRPRGRGEDGRSLGARAILLDDGFQNPSVDKDLSLVVVDAEQGFGNGLCLRGAAARTRGGGPPARRPAPVDRARGRTAQLSRDVADQPYPAASHRPSAPLATGMDWLEGERVLAFAGSAGPRNSSTRCAHSGPSSAVPRRWTITSRCPRAAAAARGEALALGAQLVTTEKDAARLPPPSATAS